MTRRIFTQEFKDQAVNLTYTSDKSVRQIADDLGINANMMNRVGGATAARAWLA